MNNIVHHEWVLKVFFYLLIEDDSWVHVHMLIYTYIKNILLLLLKNVFTDIIIFVYATDQIQQNQILQIPITLQMLMINHYFMHIIIKKKNFVPHNITYDS